MRPVFWIDQIPVWGVFSLTVAAIFSMIGIGTFFGLRISRQPDHETETPIGTIIGAALGLLAFMLAFTFGTTAQVFQVRKQLLLDEVNAIGTTYLRAGLLLEPHNNDICNLLREYVDLRVKLANESFVKNRERFVEGITYADKLQDQMWSHVVSITEVDRNSEIDALFIDSLNNMIDLQNSRVTASSYRIPKVIWYAICFITIVSMLMVGYQTGLSGKRNFKMGFMLSLMFSSVLILIVDLDRSTEGYFKLNQQPMFELHKKIQAPTKKTGQEQPLLDLKIMDEISLEQ